MSHSKFANNRMDANGKKSSSSFVSSRKSVKETKVAVVGGGLVGSMMACFLAKRDYKVELFEMRKDPRKSEHVAGKSINLALSERGRSALRLLGLEEEILQKYSIRMYSRMIHEINGRTRTIPYGTRSDEFILSVGRRFLNELLLTEAEKYSNVSIKFEHKLIDANLRDGQLKFNWEKPNSFGDDDHQGDGEQKNQTDVEVDVILGCDGAYSAVRRHMIKLLLLDYSQKYIEHGYLELCIPPTKEGDFAMPPNHLHIWPRDEFMMIALPNLDRSFTVTLFMPFKNFEMIQTETDLLDFFRKYFNDSIPLLTRDGLCQTFFNTKPSPLISIKCRPYNFENKALLMGDAAHAMVPFYGQGMNCGFEDCLELDLILEQSNKPLGSVLGEYTTKRVDNCHAIIDLAMYNYIEMRALVNRKTFLLRKSFDNLMHRMFPNFWTPLYSMVTFSRTPYHKCIQDKKWQDEIINRSLVILAIFFAFLLYIFVAKYLDTDSMILGRSHFHK